MCPTLLACRSPHPSPAPARLPGQALSSGTPSGSPLTSLCGGVGAPLGPGGHGCSARAPPPRLDPQRSGPGFWALLAPAWQWGSVWGGAGTEWPTLTGQEFPQAQAFWEKK